MIKAVGNILFTNLAITLVFQGTFLSLLLYFFNKPDGANLLYRVFFFPAPLPHPPPPLKKN